MVWWGVVWCGTVRYGAGAWLIHVLAKHIFDLPYHFDISTKPLIYLSYLTDAAALDKNVLKRKAAFLYTPAGACASLCPYSIGIA